MKIQVIIAKEIVSEGFYIEMYGHMPNPKFKSFIGGRLHRYKEAYQAAHWIESALTLVGHKAEVVNDQWAEQDGKDFCDLMAFENLKTYREIV